MLYCSAYYLPEIGIERAYWLPRAGHDIVVPTAVACIVLVPLMMIWQRRCLAKSQRGLALCVLAPLAILSFIALLGMFSAAGYSAMSIALLLEGVDAKVELTRWTRIAFVLVGVSLVGVILYALRARWSSCVRGLALLGFVYAGLAALRLSDYPHMGFGMVSAPTVARAAVSSAVSSAESGNKLIATGRGDCSGCAPARQAARAVVWIIFDELDQSLTLGSRDPNPAAAIPNLSRLSRIGVSAVQAYSPARDTEASIPALLSGYALAGLTFDERGALWLRTRNAGTHQFQEADSVFGRLPAGPRSAAILGYFHPYCTVFPSVDPCEDFVEANVGRWYDALLFFSQPLIGTARWLPGSVHLPGSLFRTFEPMYRISEHMLSDFPRYLSLSDKALVFIHVNLPHPPGDYVQRALHYPSVGNDRESYRRNLRLVDQLTGEALAQLQKRAEAQDLLLIVSSDHWLRIDSPSTPRTIPWIAWHVGESTGATITVPISTVHTAELVTDFLAGRIRHQDDIVAWWQGKAFYPTLMPHNFRY